MEEIFWPIKISGGLQLGPTSTSVVAQVSRRWYWRRRILSLELVPFGIAGSAESHFQGRSGSEPQTKDTVNGSQCFANPTQTAGTIAPRTLFSSPEIARRTRVGGLRHKQRPTRPPPRLTLIMKRRRVAGWLGRRRSSNKLTSEPLAGMCSIPGGELVAV